MFCYRLQRCPGVYNVNICMCRHVKETPQRLMFKNTGKHPTELLMPLQFCDDIFLINLVNYTVLKSPK